MSEQQRPDKLGDLLASQDQAISDEKLGEHRMKLQKELEAIEQRVTWVRKATVRACIYAVLCYFLTPILMVSGMNFRPAAAIFWMVVVAIAFLIAVPLVVVYFYKYRPQLERARQDFQTAMIQDLQRQIAELSNRLKQE